MHSVRWKRRRLGDTIQRFQAEGGQALPVLGGKPVGVENARGDGRFVLMAKKRTILFLCTGNSCRSQMAEAILRHLAGDTWNVLSAGSQPAGFIHPLAEEVMQRMNIAMDGQVSKSWDEYADTPVDVVITLCDDAAAERCPAWAGDPITAHWSLPDPAYHVGTEDDQLGFAMRVAERLRTKIQGLIELDWSMDREEIGRRLRFLGEI